MRLLNSWAMYNSRPMPTHYFSSATSRREFLRRAGLAAGALATSKLHSQTKAPRKLGIALLGLGRYSSNQLGPALRETEKCYLAGVVTGHREKGDRWAADYNLNKSNVYSYENFDRIVRDLLKVPHAEIKSKLDAEKQAKKRKKSRKSSASREASDRV